MKDPLKINICKSIINRDSEVVRISTAAVEKIQQLQAESGLAASKLVSMIILHYADDVQFVEVAIK